MRKLIIFSACTLLLAGCTAREVTVTDIVPLNMEIQEVKGSKVIFTMDPANPDAWYMYGLFNESTEAYRMNDAELARLDLKLAQDSYEIKKEAQEGFMTSFLDMYCMRGSRTLRATNLAPDTDYRMLVYQVNPKTQEPMVDNILSTTVHTRPVEEKDMDFTIGFDGFQLSIVPSDPDRIYYWDFDLAERIYDNYLRPRYYFYSLLDMFDEYNFMDEVYSKGSEVYDLKKDNLIEGAAYTLVAGATVDEEITSPLTLVTFTYSASGIQNIRQYKDDGKEL